MNKTLTTRSSTVPAMVQYNATGYHRHKLRDLSPEGAFVEMGNARMLRRDACVKLVFVHNGKGRSETHLVTAHVDEISSNGAHIVFDELDAPAQAAIQELS